MISTGSLLFEEEKDELADMLGRILESRQSV